MDTSRSANPALPDVSVPEPLVSVIDPGSFTAAEDELVTGDPLEFPGYAESLALARTKASSNESVIAGRATIGGHRVEVAGFDFSFMGGSMGQIAGERIARALSRAARRRVPFVLVTSTGGARMQEGMRALVQMPKLVVARRELTEAHEPFIAILGQPTTGGVLASIAALADYTVAEADATVGFAGPRVAESYLGKPLLEGSHTAGTALENGCVDEVVARERLNDRTAAVLGVLALGRAEAVAPPGEIDIEELPDEEDQWKVVQAARSPGRPTAPDLLKEAADSAVLLRGDRVGGEDPTVRAALASFAGRRAVAIATDRNPVGPAAYRKAIRAIGIAEGLGLPVVTIVDMPTADPSSESEAGAIAWAIAGLFQALLATPVPTVSVVTGEGGSGGALAFCTADRLIAWDGSFFSVTAPELAAEILHRDASRAPELAAALKVTAANLRRFGIADHIVSGPLEPRALRDAVAYHLDALVEAPAGDRLEARLARWRRKGE